jgi:hypothetical protein
MRDADYIAERTFELAAPHKQLIARIGRPTRHGSREWACSVHVVGLDEPEISQAYGEDSLQALLMALSMLRARISSSQERWGISWPAGTDLGLEMEPRS